jgi:hypothetical protein
MDTEAEIAEWRYRLAGEIMGAGGSGRDSLPAVSTGTVRQQVGSGAANENRSGTDSEK